jgi:glyoxylase-like metal-dependent hydrolase (beta-lactamase superfamily II)
MIHVSPLEPPGPGAAVEVADGILWLRMALPMGLDHVNVYALDDGDGWTLIDTGLATAKTRAAWETALAGPLAGRPVRRVLVTHHHPDHVGLAGWIQSRGAELLATRTAWLYARMLTLDAQDRPSAEAVAFWHRAGMPEAVQAARAGERPFNFADVVAPMPLGFTRIDEGQVLRLGGRDWTVRLGQGHAPDQATLWTDDLVLGADQLLPGISANIGVYPTEPEADPLSEWLDSCARLSAFATDRQLVLPGHKRPYRGLPQRLREMAEGHARALDRLRAALAAGPMTAWDGFAALFGRPIPAAEQGLALVEAVAHMNHLRSRGEVRAEDLPDGRRLWHAGA